MSLTTTSSSPAQTRHLGHCLASALRPGDVVALHGELGTGKTVFVQGLAQGLQVAGRVTSPTFIVMRRHEPAPAAPANTPALCHVDAYRLSGGHELLDMGLDDWLEEGVVAVEWAEHVPEALPPDHLEVRLEHAGEGRTITVVAHGPRSHELLEQLRRCGS